MHYFSGVRPFGVSLLICGYDYDEDRPFLYQCDPSVRLFIYIISTICTCSYFVGFLFSMESNGNRSQLYQWKNISRKTVFVNISFDYIY